MTVRLCVLLILLLGSRAAWDGPSARAQAPAQALQGTVVARFDDAQALAVDPRGRLYVADAGRDVVEVLDRDGRRRMVLGGAGTRPGAFDTPSDVAPTNGQVILVADTYNGRVQRFSGEGQYLGSLPIGRQDQFEESTWQFEEGRGGPPVQGNGRPIAVARDDEGSVFVLDRRERRLFKWSDVGRMEGLASRNSSRLQAPVALALGDGRRLYVADAGQAAVLRFDTFGTFRRRVPLPPLPTVRALTMHRGRLWIVCARRVLAWDRTKDRTATYKVSLPAPLVDVAFDGSTIYLLTPTRLLRRSEW